MEARIVCTGVESSRIERGTVVTGIISRESGIGYHFIKKKEKYKRVLGMMRGARGEVMLYVGAFVSKG